jgi:hypothetical protein
MTASANFDVSIGMEFVLVEDVLDKNSQIFPRSSKSRYFNDMRSSKLLSPTYLRRLSPE